MHFLTDIIDIRDDVTSLLFSNGSSLSSHDLNDMCCIWLPVGQIDLSFFSFFIIIITFCTLM